MAAGVDTGRMRSAPRNSRLSALAQSINSWEDDLKHSVTRNEDAKQPIPAARVRNLNTAAATAELITSEPSCIPPASILPTSSLSKSLFPVKKSTETPSTTLSDESTHQLSLHENEISVGSSKALDLPKISTVSSHHDETPSEQNHIENVVFRKSTLKAADSNPHRSGVQTRLPPVSERMADWRRKIDDVFASQTSATPHCVSGTEASVDRLMVVRPNSHDVSDRSPVRLEPTPRTSIIAQRNTVASQVAASSNSAEELFSNNAVKFNSNKAEALCTTKAEKLNANMAEDLNNAEKLNSNKADERYSNKAEQLNLNKAEELCANKDPSEKATVSGLTTVIGGLEISQKTVSTPLECNGAKTAGKYVSSAKGICSPLRSDSDLDDRNSGAHANSVSNSEASEVKTSSVGSSAKRSYNDDDAGDDDGSDDENDDDEGDEDGVFELLDDALGDSVSNTSQQSHKSERQAESGRQPAFSTATPPTDGGSVSSSQNSSTVDRSSDNSPASLTRAGVKQGSTGHSAAGLSQAGVKPGSGEGKAGHSAASLLRQRFGSSGGSRGASGKTKQKLRTASDGSALKEDRGMVYRLADQRATFISYTGLNGDTDTVTSLSCNSNRSSKLWFERRSGFGSALGLNAVMSPACDTRNVTNRPRADHITTLQDLAAQEQCVIVQTSNALNQCCHAKSSFATSSESIECHRVLLLAYKKQELYRQEVARLTFDVTASTPSDDVRASGGNLTITNLSLPCKTELLSKLASGDDIYVVVMISCEGVTYFSQMVSSRDVIKSRSLEISGIFQFVDVPGSFQLKVEIFTMEIEKVQPVQKKKKSYTPKKLIRLMSTGRFMPKSERSSGVRASKFQLTAAAIIAIGDMHRTSFRLEEILPSVLQGSLSVNIQSCMTRGLEERGFLTLFEDVNGFASWQRRWCLLNNDTLSYWNYPDDENNKEPAGQVDLKSCTTLAVDLMPRDVCARPNTFELITAKPRRPDDVIGLTRTCGGDVTTSKYWLAADTREDRMAWCDHLNWTLRSIRVWLNQSTLTEDSLC